MKRTVTKKNPSKEGNEMTGKDASRKGDVVDIKGSSFQAAKLTSTMRKHLQKRAKEMKERHHKQMRGIEKVN